MQFRSEFRRNSATEGRPVLDELPSVVTSNGIDFGVVAVPGEEAQNAADLLVLSGVRGILSFAPTRVVAPRRVHVVTHRIMSSFLLLAANAYGSV